MRGAVRRWGMFVRAGPARMETDAAYYVEAALAGRRNPGTAAVGSSGHEMSTAERIRKLLHLSNTEIARRLGCSPAYVRTVRQRTSSNGSPILRPSDRRWNAEVTRARAQMRAAKRR